MVRKKIQFNPQFQFLLTVVVEIFENTIHEKKKNHRYYIENNTQLNYQFEFLFLPVVVDIFFANHNN